MAEVVHKSVPTPYLGDRTLVYRKDFATSLSKFKRQYVEPIVLPIEQVAYYMIKSGKYAPDQSWMVPDQGRGYDLARMQSWMNVMRRPDDASFLDVCNVFLKVPDTRLFPTMQNYLRTCLGYKFSGRDEDDVFDIEQQALRGGYRPRQYSRDNASGGSTEVSGQGGCSGEGSGSARDEGRRGVSDSSVTTSGRDGGPNYVTQHGKRLLTWQELKTAVAAARQDNVEMLMQGEIDIGSIGQQHASIHDADDGRYDAQDGWTTYWKDEEGRVRSSDRN